MVRKKVILALLASTMLFTALAPHSLAADTNPVGETIVPLYEIVNDTTSRLTISGTTATCKSTATGDLIQSITAEQTLQKYWGLWIWNEVDNASWTKTVNGSSISMSNTKSGLDSGTYRLQTEFTVTTSDGKTETVTVYSEEKTVG